MLSKFLNDLKTHPELLLYIQHNRFTNSMVPGGQEQQGIQTEWIGLNDVLEQQIHECILELQQFLKFESVLKRISERVRDSLDQHQILQNAVEELSIALDISCCDVALHAPDNLISTIQSSNLHYQLDSGETLLQQQLLCIEDSSEIYNQIQTHQTWFAFCPIQPLLHDHFTILVCPILDHQGDQRSVLGTFWLFKESGSSFGLMDIHLVQQVASQCAIALCQAKLYEAIQSEVQNRHRLDQLKDDFLSTISHELRTPIANIKMATEMLAILADQEKSLALELKRSLPRNNRALQYLNVLKEECDRALKLIEDLLHLQHLEAGTHPQQIASIHLENWLRHVIEPFETLTHNQQQVLQIDLAPDLPTLMLDPFSLSRVITELLNNACKYTPPKERISVAAQILQVSDAASPFLALQLIVANTGIEIPADALPHIFDKFYRIPNHNPWKYGGTGLGLALVKKLVEQMEGVIFVASHNHQTQFTVQLPITL